MSKKTNTTATLNFSLMNDEALELLNAALLNVQKLSLAEADLNQAKKNLPVHLQGKLETYTLKAERKAALQRETTAKNETKARANAVCTAFFTRYMDTADTLTGDIYHFNMSGLLRNLGILTGEVDDLKNSAIKKIEGIASMVVDRYVSELVKRKAGDAFLTHKEGRYLRNNPDELTLAFAEGLANSGCFEWDKFQLVRVDFSKKAE